MPPTMCRDCLYFRCERSQCWRHPPVLINNNSGLSARPPTRPDEGCGDGERVVIDTFATAVWAERLVRIKQLAIDLRVKGDPDLRSKLDKPITPAQETWLLYGGVQRAIEILEGKE